MKRIARIIIATMFFAFLGSAQAQDNLSIKYFNGGAYNVQFSFDSAIFSGVGLRSAGMGGILSGMGADPAMIVRHPAGLATLRRPRMVFDVTPPIHLNLSSMADIEGSIESTVDESLADYNVPKSDIEYPGLDVQFGQTGITGAGGIVYPTPQGNFAFSIYRPLTMSLNVLGSGFSTMIETYKAIGDNVTVVQFATQMSPSIRFDLQATAASLSYGVALNRHVALGASVDWITARLGLNAFFKLDGIMLLRQEGAAAGQEYAFNDPYDTSIRTEDGEQNTLDQWAIGSYRGSGWGMKFSTMVLLKRWWSLDFAVSSPPTLKMNGAMEFIQNMIPALTAENLLSSDDNAELFDVTELNLAKPTLTKRFVNPTDSTMQIQLPGSATFGTSLALGSRAMLALNYVQYFGEFSYTYLKYHHGLKLKNSVRFGMTVPFAWFLSPETIVLKLLGVPQRPVLRFGFGITNADELKEGFSYQDGSKPYAATGIIIPSFAIGKSFTLIRNVDADVLLIGLPASLLKMSFLYKF